MAEKMQTVIQIENGGGGVVVVYAELLAVVYFVFASCTTDKTQVRYLLKYLNTTY